MNGKRRPYPSTFSRGVLYSEIREYEERNKRMRNEKKRVDSVIVKGIHSVDMAGFANSFGAVCQQLIGVKPIMHDIFSINREKKIFRVKIKDRDHRSS